MARLGGQPTAEDQAAFSRWRDADPRHAEAYDRIAGIWSQAGRLSRSPAARNMPSATSPSRPRAFGFALAASLAAAFLVTTLLLGSRWLTEPASQPEPMLFASSVGEIREIDLPDGSRLTLDSGSRVGAEFTKAGRTLTLKEGRARFRVAHERRAFVVRAGSSEIVATGTLFDVSLIGGRTAVVLMAGSVEVRGVNAPWTRGDSVERLKPGQKLIITDSAQIERQPATRSDTAWSSRMLEFDDSRLDEAATQANRYSKVKVTLGDERIRGLRVSGAFRAGDAASFARSLAAAFDLRVVRQPDGNLLLVDPNPGDRAPAH